MNLVCPVVFPFLVNVAPGRRCPRPWRYLDHTVNLALRDKSPVAAIIRNAPVVSKNKILAAWNLSRPIVFKPVVLDWNTLEGPITSSIIALVCVNVILVDLLVINVNIAVLGLNGVPWNPDHPLNIVGSRGYLRINTISIKDDDASPVNFGRL